MQALIKGESRAFWSGGVGDSRRIASWAIITGILEVAAAIRLREEIRGEWALGLSGLLSIILGILLAVFPAAGIVALTWMIAAYAILFGVLSLVLAFRLRGHAESLAAQAAQPTRPV